MPAAPIVPTVLDISRPDIETLRIPIIGLTPLLVHQWSEKAKRQMLHAQQGVKKIKDLRDPEAEFAASLYRAGEDRYGVPAVAFKAATVSAARLYGKTVRMTELRQLLRFPGRIYPTCNQALFLLEGDEPKLQEDMVTVGISGTDLRYRGVFTNWSTVLDVQYVKSAITRDSVLSLTTAAGLTVGVCEWRPEKNGDFGTFEIDQTREIEAAN